MTHILIAALMIMSTLSIAIEARTDFEHVSTLPPVGPHVSTLPPVGPIQIPKYSSDSATESSRSDPKQFSIASLANDTNGNAVPNSKRHRREVGEYTFNDDTGSYTCTLAADNTTLTSCEETIVGDGHSCLDLSDYGILTLHPDAFVLLGNVTSLTFVKLHYNSMIDMPTTLLEHAGNLSGSCSLVTKIQESTSSIARNFNGVQLEILHLPANAVVPAEETNMFGPHMLWQGFRSSTFITCDDGPSVSLHKCKPLGA